MKNLKLFLTAVSALLVVHCSNDSSSEGSMNQASNEEKVVGTCDHSSHPSQSQKQCREWVGEAFKQFDLSISCNAIQNAVYSAEDRCSTAALVGTCVLDESGSFETRFYYYESDWTESAAQSNCQTKSTTNTSAVWRSSN